MDTWRNMKLKHEISAISCTKRDRNDASNNDSGQIMKLMEKIMHQLIGSWSQSVLQSFLHPRWLFFLNHQQYFTNPNYFRNKGTITL